MEAPSATRFFKDEIEKAKQVDDPEVRARVERIVAEATAEWSAYPRMVSVHSHVYQKLLQAGLVQART
jgi:hypothetical protein